MKLLKNQMLRLVERTKAKPVLTTTLAENQRADLKIDSQWDWGLT
ncbi:hypothetical protein [Aliikangiella coralliicola]|nr:hypothetical protein [Aliikangiella coralliicola]